MLVTLDGKILKKTKGQQQYNYKGFGQRPKPSGGAKRKRAYRTYILGKFDLKE